MIFTIDPVCVGSASGVNTAHNIVTEYYFYLCEIKFSVTFDVSEVTFRSISISFPAEYIG